MPELRGSPRVPIDLPLTLSRGKGGAVHAHTIDLGSGGACVSTDRPLRVDETLSFDLEIDSTCHCEGRCRVLRTQGLNIYALRFEAWMDGGQDLVERAITSYR